MSALRRVRAARGMREVAGRMSDAGDRGVDALNAPGGGLVGRGQYIEP